MPESVTNLPTQLQELKESYLKTAETVDALRKEVGLLRSEVEALKNENARLQQAVGSKVAADDRSSLLKPVEVSADELAAAWKADKEKAAATYGGRYLRVVGLVDAFESASQDVIVILKTNGDRRVRCQIRRDRVSTSRSSRARAGSSTATTAPPSSPWASPSRSSGPARAWNSTCG